MSGRSHAEQLAGQECTPERFLDLLGLPATADAATVHARYDDVSTYLSNAPTAVQPWSHHHLDQLRDGYDRWREHLSDIATTSADGSPARHATGTAAASPQLNLDEDLPADQFDEDEFRADPPTTPTPATTPTARPRPKAAVGRRIPVVDRPHTPDQGASEATPATAGKARSRLLAPALALLLAVGVIYGVYQAGRPDTPAHSAAPGAPATVQVDQAKVKELTDKVNADPRDVASLRALTDQYYGAGEYAKAAEWQHKVVELQPKDVSSRLVLAASLANSGDAARAEKEWTTVTEMDPKSAEAYYNLGVLHFSANPPDVEKAKAEWRKVVEIDPDSKLAKNVSSHMDRMGPAASAGAKAASAAPSAATPSAGTAESR
ncbi:hypothetical protein KEM60_01012 [Austwickia sp. TVS 96-490-7B]|uniref:tetratricopeptide repeat protein n=1 Tax=Austwickia sp. TVS 96-490-7B TaxID=2830843 RepID=UPI001C59640C|nr:hypothetical protein [Austwickia sp. TVS 96-490-7B]MBW3084823.1 hypothetical protein [Austwickia sp. TVS 96-490-7B]